MAPNSEPIVFHEYKPLDEMQSMYKALKRSMKKTTKALTDPPDLQEPTHPQDPKTIDALNKIAVIMEKAYKVALYFDTFFKDETTTHSIDIRSILLKYLNGDMPFDYLCDIRLACNFLSERGGKVGEENIGSLSHGTWLSKLGDLKQIWGCKTTDIDKDQAWQNLTDELIELQKKAMMYPKLVHG